MGGANAPYGQAISLTSMLVVSYIFDDILNVKRAKINPLNNTLSIEVVFIYFSKYTGSVT